MTTVTAARTAQAFSTARPANWSKEPKASRTKITLSMALPTVAEIDAVTPKPRRRSGV